MTLEQQAEALIKDNEELKAQVELYKEIVTELTAKQSPEHLKQHNIALLKDVVKQYAKVGGDFDNFFNDYVVNLEQGDERI